jgi:hypothetical protein
MRALHLEGMGVMGSLIAHQLRDRGIDFTWHDTEAKVNAWRACTGVIYPSGVKLDNKNHKRWAETLEGNFNPYARWMEAATFCHYSQHAPHNGRSTVLYEVGGVRVSNAYTYHLDAQSMVHETRRILVDQRRTRNQYGRLCIVTHGFRPERIGAWSWGWSAKVMLDLHPKLKSLHFRPCLYMRDGFVLDYLYPVPMTDRWYAGTTLVAQQKPKELLIAPKYLAWMDRMERKADGAFYIVADCGPYPELMVQGWRPVPKDDTPLVERVGDTIYVRAQYGSGIRHFWTLWDKLEEYVT